jgi:hypothetical protein
MPQDAFRDARVLDQREQPRPPRTFGIDVLDCPRCGGRLRLLALIEAAPT